MASKKPKPHRNWYHKKSGKGRTRLEVKVMIKDLILATQEEPDPVRYVELLGMINALRWVINWTDLDENFNEISNKEDKK